MNTYWITEDALEYGIRKVKGDTYYTRSTIYVPSLGLDFRAGEYHTTYAAAVADAERRRLAKIAGLKKQLAKLRKMTFDAKEPK